MNIELFDLHYPEADVHPEWRLVTDTVMGGISTGKLNSTEHLGSVCTEMRGEVSLDNNGGFVQMRLGLPEPPPTKALGIYLEAAGNQAPFGVHLRTRSLQHPWQSFRCRFEPSLQWQSFYLPFSRFNPHRTQVDFSQDELHSIGLVAIGEAGPCQLFMRRLSLYRVTQ